MDLTPDELADLPAALWLHPPLKAVKARPELWEPYADRLALWGMKTSAEAAGLPFTPAVLIADGI
jgi:glycerophosphoryl diester phosphodiesterase